MRFRTAVAGMIAVLLAGCAATEADVAAVGPKTVRDIDPRLVEGPFVHAGTRFTVRVDQPIDTEFSTAGTPFTARAEVPLRGTDGKVLVPAGALLRAHVVSTESDGQPRIRVELDSIDTVFGPTRITAAVEHAQRQVYSGPPVVLPTPAPYLMDDYLYPIDFYGYGYGGYRNRVFLPREIHIPVGAVLTLVLMRPLFAPGDRIHPEPPAN